MALASIDPTNGNEIKTYPQMREHEVDQRIKRANNAQREWRQLSFDQRSTHMKNIADTLRERKGHLARLAAQEMGKPLKQGESEIDKCVWVCEYYADKAQAFLDIDVVETDAYRSFVCYEPLGVILAVMPWNFPFWQVFRGAAPALMAGNSMVLKHAGNVTGCALAIHEVFNDSSAPKSLFETLLITSDHVANVIEHPAIAAVTLTGSTPAGKAVASRAGSVLKKCVLELGGSDPYIILEDANLEEAANACATSRMINTGQSCVAAKRFIVHKDVRKKFEAHLVGEIKKYKPKNPFEDDALAGPLARMDLRNSLHDQVRRSVDQGAKILLGGKIPGGEGAFYPATVLTGVTKGMAVYSEETFGPVASIIEADNEKEAIRIANDSIFGLGAAVFTADKERGEGIAKKLETGCCFVNSFVKSDPRLPFGGIKQSGFGRELGIWGIREFVNVKSVSVG